MPTELKSSAFPQDETPGGEPRPQGQAAADFSADVSLVLDALGRMEATARADRAALERLRGTLGAMAATIAAAKAALAAGGGDSGETATLLDELEHLADTMIEAAGGVGAVAAGTAPAAKSAEPENVPTVTAVVSQFAASTADESQSALLTIDAAQEAAVSELKAMLEAMNASAASPVEVELAAEAEPIAAEVEPGVAEVEPIAAETEPGVAETELGVAEVEPAVAAQAAIISIAALPEPAEPVASTPLPETSAGIDAPPAPPPRAGLFLEQELLASFERMGALPILPPEEGTAVIFPRRPDTSAMATLPVPDIVPAASAAPEIAAVAFTPQAAATSVEPEAAAPAQADIGDETAAPLAEFAPAEKPAATAAVAPSADIAIALPEAEFDPNDFLFGPETVPDPALFGPEPEPDPDAFLLEPVSIVPPRVAIPVLPQPDFVSAAAPATAPAEPAALVTAELVPQPEPPQPASARAHDPLHALNAMSEWEKIALFS